MSISALVGVAGAVPTQEEAVEFLGLVDTIRTLFSEGHQAELAALHQPTDLIHTALNTRIWIQAHPADLSDLEERVGSDEQAEAFLGILYVSALASVVAAAPAPLND